MAPSYSHKGKSPTIHKDAFISPLATIVGDAEIRRGVSVFPGAVIRGDVAKIIIGEYSNIQDNVVIHGGDIYKGDVLTEHLPVEIGSYVTVAHGSVVHGSKIGDVSMVGINAVIFEGSVVGEGSIIGLSAAVLKDSRIPPRSIAVGVPAKVVKKTDDLTYSKIKKHALWYHELADSHRGTLFP